MVEVPDEGFPAGVYWNRKELNFYDDKGVGMGDKFFDKWKDSREEFPQSVVELADSIVEEPLVPPKPIERPSGSVPRRRPSGGRPSGTPAPLTPPPVVGEAMLALAYERKALYDAYVTAGFTRDEALELCTK